MSPQEALDVFERIRQQVQLSGQQHDVLRQAIATLARLVQKHDETAATAKPEAQ